MTQSLTLEQQVPAPVSQVWDAWTTPEGLATWWWPHLPDTTYSVDLRPGGAYRIESPSVGIGVTGEYVVLDRPRRIHMTWTWLGGSENHTEHVRVDFTETAADTTLVRVRHDVAGGQEAADSYRTGWIDVLARLGQVPRPAAQARRAAPAGPA